MAGARVVLEALSLGGYVELFRTVFSCHGMRIGWAASYQITMAGAVATKLFAAGGAGGVALTVWALRASGLSARSVARRVLALEFFLYGVRRNPRRGRYRSAHRPVPRAVAVDTDRRSRDPWRRRHRGAALHAGAAQ